MVELPSNRILPPSVDWLELGSTDESYLPKARLKFIYFIYAQFQNEPNSYKSKISLEPVKKRDIYFLQFNF